MKIVVSKSKMIKITDKLAEEVDAFINGIASEYVIRDVVYASIKGETELVTVLYETDGDKKEAASVRDDKEKIRMAVDAIYKNNSVSINFVQMECGFGFNKASEIIGILESKGIISKKRGTKAREILVDYSDAIELLEE